MTRLSVRKYPPDHYFIGDGESLIAVIRNGASWRVLFDDEIVPNQTWLEAWRLVKELIKSPAA